MKGFTLIELLVVVLIIGILAAVSVPQYQRAAAKSRVAAMYPIVKSLVAAEESYFAANGAYTCDLDKLDISLNFGEPFSGPYGTSVMTGQKTKEWKLGCLDNGNWWSIRAISQNKTYPIELQYSLTKWGNAAPGWYCIGTACEKLFGLSSAARVVSGWHGNWYKMNIH